ncbi:hypothetical protein [Streptomyces sp. NPDC088925]|uniref:hypothetical protein n=1 Tax=Streptomyces sp. NPDC088925 TaxID=3365914 RepID=UPI003812B7B9
MLWTEMGPASFGRTKGAQLGLFAMDDEGEGVTPLPFEEEQPGATEQESHVTSELDQQ